MSSLRPAVFWNRLRKKLRDNAEAVSTMATEVSTGYGKVRFAVGGSGEPRLLVPCAPGSRLPPIAARNLEVRLAKWELEGQDLLYVDLTCLGQNLESVFAQLTNEILKRVQSGASPVDAVVGGIRDFRDLLKEPNVGASNEVIAGLLGELLVLQRLCAVRADAIKSWTGPESHRHDFRRGNNALEVKTSLRSDRRIVTIHGIDQLSAPSGGTLVLFHVRMERSDAGELSVARLVSDLMAFGVDESSLRTALCAAGCSDHTSPEWNHVSFHLEGVQAYRVHESFPAITRSLFRNRVPSGLLGVTYEVNLDLASAFALDEAGTRTAIDRFLS